MLQDIHCPRFPTSFFLPHQPCQDCESKSQGGKPRRQVSQSDRSSEQLTSQPPTRRPPPASAPQTKVASSASAKTSARRPLSPASASASASASHHRNTSRSRVCLSLSPSLVGSIVSLAVLTVLLIGERSELQLQLVSAASSASFARPRVHTMEKWSDYLLSHFYAIKMRPVSAFDPSGFMILIAGLLLVFGVVLSTAQQVVHVRKMRESAEKNIQDVKMRMKKNIKEVTDYVTTTRSQVEENLLYVKSRAIHHSKQHGFITEMLSFAYLSRLGFSLGLFVSATYLNVLASVIAGWRTPNVVILDLNRQDSGEKTLPDLGHDLFKFVMGKIYGDTTYIEWFDLPDQFILTISAVVGTFLVVHPRKLLIIRRLCAIYASINLLRACCVAVTSLPDASPMCISQFETDRGAYKSMPMFPKAFIRAWKVLVRPSQHITCGDMVFSGHCVYLMLCVTIVMTYCQKQEVNTPFVRRYPYVLWMVRYLVYALAAAGVFAIVGTRLHYTLDVLIAVYITMQFWFTYHWMCTYPKLAFGILTWLEHEEVHFIDLESYRFARHPSTIIDEDDKTK